MKHPLNSIFDRITRDFQDGLAEYVREIMSRSVAPTQMGGLPGGRGFDAYMILGLDRDCSDEEVKRRFRELARILHPDTSRCQGTGFLFTLVNLSYEQIGRERGFK